MNFDNVPYSHYEEQVEELQTQKLRDAIGKYVYHWPLFLLFLLLSFSAAFLYLKRMPPVYTVKARLLIQDDEKGTGSEPALQEINLFKTRTLVENETEVLKSRSLVEEMVKELQLPIQYWTADKFKRVDLYTNSPVRFTLLIPYRSFNNQTIDIVIKDQKTFILKQPNSETVMPFAAQLKNKIGVWTLRPTDNLNRYIGKKIRITLSNPTDVIDNYTTNLDVELSNKKATVLDLSIKDAVPQRGKDVLNALIRVYNHAAVDDKNKIRQSTLDFIDQRLSHLTGQLNSSEQEIEGFKSSSGLMDISSESQLFLENVKNNDAKLNEVNVQLEVVDGIEKYVNSPQGTGNAPATAGLNDQGLVALINQLISLELQRDQLLSSTPETSPVMEPINRQISSTKYSIRENIKGTKAALLATRNRLQSINSGVEASIKKLPSQEREFIGIKRQQSIKEELYIYLLRKREEAAVSYASTIADSRTIDQAYFGKPDSSKGLIIYGLALIAGLLIPFCSIWVRSKMNNKVLSAKEIQTATSVPVLGELVYQKSNSPMVIHDKNRRMVAEQFRVLCANLKYIKKQKGEGLVTLLTSGMSGEGKSFITCNLGAALAASGRKTIILELDMRNPVILKYLDIQPSAGISDYINGDAYIEDIICPTNISKNLFVAGAGTLPEYPSELLQTDRMNELMDWLTINFDEILIDTPPIQLVADATLLSKYSDINLYVVRQGVTYKSHLEYIQKLFSEQKLKNLNVVFNGIDIERWGKAYQYNYYIDKQAANRPVLQTSINDFLKRF